MQQDITTPLVTIRCLTYNHEPYIRQCLEGFVMQKTSFKFEAIVHDDASTDGTANIVREFAEKYPDIIKPIFQTENQYSKRNGEIRRVMNAQTRGKYIALCEGDDYWTDPLKLQKQVDFLEANEEYGLVCTRAIIFNQKENIFHKPSSTRSIDLTFYDLLVSNTVITPTACFRTSFTKHLLQISNMPDVIAGDYKLWLYMAKQLKVKKMSDTTSVYRVIENSLSHKKENLEPLILGVMQLFEYYVDTYIENRDSKEFKKLIKAKSKNLTSQIITSPSLLLSNEYIRLMRKYGRNSNADRLLKFCVANNLIGALAFYYKVKTDLKKIVRSYLIWMKRVFLKQQILGK